MSSSTTVSWDLEVSPWSYSSSQIIDIPDDFSYAIPDVPVTDEDVAAHEEQILGSTAFPLDFEEYRRAYIDELKIVPKDIVYTAPKAVSIHKSTPAVFPKLEYNMEEEEKFLDTADKVRSMFGQKPLKRRRKPKKAAPQLETVTSPPSGNLTPGSPNLPATANKWVSPKMPMEKSKRVQSVMLSKDTRTTKKDDAPHGLSQSQILGQTSSPENAVDSVLNASSTQSEPQLSTCGLSESKPCNVVTQSSQQDIQNQSEVPKMASQCLPVQQDIQQQKDIQQQQNIQQQQSIQQQQQQNIQQQQSTQQQQNIQQQQDIQQHHPLYKSEIPVLTFTTSSSQQSQQPLSKPDASPQQAEVKKSVDTPPTTSTLQTCDSNPQISSPRLGGANSLSSSPSQQSPKWSGFVKSKRHDVNPGFFTLRKSALAANPSQVSSVNTSSSASPKSSPRGSIEQSSLQPSSSSSTTTTTVPLSSSIPLSSISSPSSSNTHNTILSSSSTPSSITVSTNETNKGWLSYYGKGRNNTSSMSKK